jgi:hypothetical protein
MKTFKTLSRLFNRHIWGSSQNLNIVYDDWGNPVKKGAKRWHGRCWLYIYDKDDANPTTLGLEWSFGRRCTGSRFQLTLNGGDGNRISLSVGLHRVFSFHPSIEGPWLRRLMPGELRKSYFTGEIEWFPVERMIGIAIHDGRIWFSLWENPMEWNRDDPWWWQFSFSPVDFLLGDENYSTQDMETGRIDVEMPEGHYLASYRLFESTWKRPRWPWPKRIIRCEVEPDIAIPIPGKGENPWDLGDDAIHSGTYPVEVPVEAAQQMADSALRTRRRYGGANWKPDAGWPIAT